ncbi:unnamed protein product [Caenorhabditis angaria]|uniref:Uncharacterized protein n=1 Tax=Caenorhabditis angaria TaxID=860376 RepID=A0A9P1N1X8_9PELO|nr:unnamed protein product [Caenorhabditis angaria]
MGFRDPGYPNFHCFIEECNYFVFSQLLDMEKGNPLSSKYFVICKSSIRKMKKLIGMDRKTDGVGGGTTKRSRKFSSLGLVSVIVYCSVDGRQDFVEVVFV